MTLFIRKILGSLLILSFVQIAQATTIQKFEFKDIVNISELIVQGEVVDVSSFASADLVYTRVLIKVDDVLKGPHPGEFIELDFLGGNQNGKSVQIAGQDIPIYGERGFYFIEDLSMNAVNPLTGWGQGHFIIVQDAKGKEYLEKQMQYDSDEIVELANKKSSLATKLRNMKFSSTLVEKAYFNPTTPEQLRDAVMGMVSGAH